MLENEVIETEVSTSDTVNTDAPATTEQANVEVAEEAPAETVTLTKAELQEQKNAVAKKERERAERKSTREIQALRAEFEAYKAPPAVVREGKPTLDQFDSYDEFTEAITDWKLDQRDTVRQQAESAREQGAKRGEAQKRFTANADKFRETTPDYDEVMAEIADVELSHGMIEAVIDSDISAQLTYYFGKNQDEFDRINALSPLSAAREIGKIEAKILSKPIQTSSAPSPINPVSQSKATITKDPEKMSDEEWYAQEKRVKARK